LAHANLLICALVSDNYEDLGYGRLAVPRRWSEGVGSEPLQLFLLVEEGIAAKVASVSKLLYPFFSFFFFYLAVINFLVAEAIRY